MTTTYDIMVDVDDVLFPLAVGLHAKAHEMGLHDNTVEALEIWHGHLQYKCPVENWIEVFDVLLTEGFYLNARPIPGAVEAIRRLAWAGHRIHIVTARGFMAHGDIIREQTHQWLEEFAVPADSVTFAKDKAQAMYRIMDEVLDLGEAAFDFAIDDGPHNYDALQNVGVRVYLLDQPHNRTHLVPQGRRLYTVDKFVDIVLKEAS